MFPVAQAEMLDKYANLMSLYQKLGIDDKYAAAKERYDAARNAKDHGGLMNLMTQAQFSAAHTEAESNQRLNAAVELLLYVVNLAKAPPGKDTASAKQIVANALLQVKNYDSNFSWASYKEAPDNYAVKLGEDHAAVIKLKQCFAEFEALAESSADFASFHAAATEKDYYTKLTNLMTEAAIGRNTVAGDMHTVAEAAAGYHAAFDSVSNEVKAGPTGEIYRRIFTIEKESTSAQQFIRRLADEDHRSRVESSYRFMGSYWGVDFIGVHKIKRVWDFFENVLWLSQKSLLVTKGITTAEGYRDYLKKGLDAAMSGRAPLECNTKNQYCMLWSNRLILDDVYDALLNPPDLIND